MRNAGLARGDDAEDDPSKAASSRAVRMEVAHVGAQAVAQSIVPGYAEVIQQGLVNLTGGGMIAGRDIWLHVCK